MNRGNVADCPFLAQLVDSRLNICSVANHYIPQADYLCAVDVSVNIGEGKFRGRTSRWREAGFLPALAIRGYRSAIGKPATPSAPWNKAMC